MFLEKQYQESVYLLQNIRFSLVPKIAHLAAISS